MRYHEVSPAVMNEVAVVFGRGIRVERATSRFLGMLGYAEDEAGAISLPIASLVSGFAGSSSEVCFSEGLGLWLRALGMPQLLEWKRKDGVAVPLWVKQVSYDRESRSWIWIVLPQDMQPARELAAEFERLNDLLVQSRDWLAARAHDMRLPLTSMVLVLDMIQQGKASLAGDSLRILQEATTQLRELVEETADFAKGNLGADGRICRSVDLGAVTKRCVEMIAPIAQKRGITINADFPGEMIPVQCDPAGFSKVLLNLLDNAVKYSLEEGEINVRLERAEDRSGKRCLRVGVSDQGPGIPEHLRERIFERNFRVGGPEGGPGGNGLGLFIAREVVTSHRGEIWIEQNPGGGSTFWFTIPLDPVAGFCSTG